MAPPKEFEQGFVPDPSHNTAAQDTRPGKQSALSPGPIDDVYADGTPYRGSGKLEGKVALITGGDSGLGRASAILFAIEGAKAIAIVYLKEEQQDAEDTKKEIEKKSDGTTKVLLLPSDLKEAQNCIDVVEKTVKEFGQIDTLFNNAAQQLENHDILTLEHSQWEDAFKLNIHSFFYVAKAAIKYMKEGSTIINNASINAYVGRPDLLEYTATKGAVVSFTRGLSNQIVGKKKIRVNAVAPGPIWTPLVPSTFSKENVEGVDSVPIGRPGQPIEVASCVVFLASNDSSYVSGQVIHCNGGVIVNG